VWVHFRFSCKLSHAFHAVTASIHSFAEDFMHFSFHPRTDSFINQYQYQYLLCSKWILKYYKGIMVCEELTCGQRNRMFLWKGQRPVCMAKNCNGTMHPEVRLKHTISLFISTFSHSFSISHSLYCFLKYDAKKLYTQLLYLSNMWNVDKIIEKLDSMSKSEFLQIEWINKISLYRFFSFRPLFDFVVTFVLFVSVQIERHPKKKVMICLKEHVDKTLAQNAFGQIDLSNLFGFFQLS
jgi:hypothetical protein